MAVIEVSEVEVKIYEEEEETTQNRWKNWSQVTEGKKAGGGGRSQQEKSTRIENRGDSSNNKHKGLTDL